MPITPEQRREMLRQIARESAQPFARIGIPPWPEVEDILAKALTKDPAGRFESMAARAARWKAIESSPST